MQRRLRAALFSFDRFLLGSPGVVCVPAADSAAGEIPSRRRPLQTGEDVDAGAPHLPAHG